MWHDYYHWLVDLLCDDYLKDLYQKLLTEMFNTRFMWSIEYDSNRESDGLRLRKDYTNATHCVLSSDRDCSLLEMFIALCKKCEDDLMYDPDLGDRTGYWFWNIVENMGLDIYDDYNFDCDAVNTILERFNARDYERDGFGGPFYVCNPVCDFRDVDLWQQLNMYLNENFPL